VDKPARDLRALTSDLANLRADIEHYRAELREVVDRFLDEYGARAEPVSPDSRLARRSGRGPHCLRGFPVVGPSIGGLTHQAVQSVQMLVSVCQRPVRPAR
jgi:hypothetical protein